MIRVCMRCHKIMGEKAPFWDKSETHGYCDPCLAIVLEEYRKRMREAYKDQIDPYNPIPGVDEID